MAFVREYSGVFCENIFESITVFVRECNGVFESTVVFVREYSGVCERV